MALLNIAIFVLKLILDVTNWFAFGQGVEGFLCPQLRRSLGGILVRACPSVRLCVTLALGQEPLEIGS